MYDCFLYLRFLYVSNFFLLCLCVGGLCMCLCACCMCMCPLYACIHMEFWFEMFSVDVTLLIHIFLSSSLPTLGVSDISLSKATNEVVCHIDSHLKIGFRKNWHPLMSLNRLLIMHLRWLHLIILYQLKVMYLFLRTLETWQEQLRVIVVFWDTGKQFLLTGKIVFWAHPRF